MTQQLSPGEEVNPFSTDPEDELPVGVQLSWRLRALITTGQLGHGEPLPSFRNLAQWSGVNVNTVRSVYAGLEREGLVVTRQGRGTFVADGVEPAPALEEIAADALRRARDAGLSPRDLATVAAACASMPGVLEGGARTNAPEALPGVAEQSEAIEVRHELRRQIARLELDLATYPHDAHDAMPTAHRRAEPHVAGVEELEQTRDTLIAQLSEARRAAEERARKLGRTRARQQELIGSAEQTRPGPTGRGPLEKAMGWWRRKL
jgi:DNA-binding transcriptional regulator YhcF (GntR family)